MRDSAVLLVVPSCVNQVSVNPIMESKTRLVSHEQTPTRDNIFHNLLDLINMLFLKEYHNVTKFPHDVTSHIHFIRIICQHSEPGYVSCYSDGLQDGRAGFGSLQE
jgi:hypothetical protein